MTTDVSGLIQTFETDIIHIWDETGALAQNVFQASPTQANAIVGLMMLDDAFKGIFPLLQDAYLLQLLNPAPTTAATATPPKST